MLEFLNWKLTLSALVVCLLFYVQCAPPTTTRVNLELICNETIAAVSPQDCQSCPVKGCEFELLQAGCWKDSDHWYKSCMGELGPCIKIRWEENNDGSYSNSECRSRCPHLHETCDFMPVLLTTTLKVPIAGPAKIAPADTSMTVGLIIGTVIGSLLAVAAVIIIAVAAVFGIKKLIERRKIAKKAKNDENPAFATDDDASGAGRSTASSSSRHPTLAANVSSTLESELLISDQQESAETPVTRSEDDNPVLETVHSDIADEFAAPSHEEQIAPEIDQWNASGSKATTSVNTSEEIVEHQKQVRELAGHHMDEDRDEELRLDQAAGGSLPVDQHGTNSGGVKPSEPLEPIITVTVPPRTQKDASTGAPTPQDALTGAPTPQDALTGAPTPQDGLLDSSGSSGQLRPKVQGPITPDTSPPV